VNIPGLDQSTSDVVTALASLTGNGFPLELEAKHNGMIESCDMLMAEVLTDKGDVPFYIPVEFGSATIDALQTTAIFNVVDQCTVTGVRFHLPSQVFHGQTKVMPFGSPKVVIPSDTLNISWPTPLATL
jgi:hypothetical protein